MNRLLELVEAHATEPENKMLAINLHLHFMLLSVEDLKRLITAGLDVNYRFPPIKTRINSFQLLYPENMSLLHYAAKKGRKKLIKELLKEGADVTATNSCLKTPLIIFMENSRCTSSAHDVIKKFLMHGSSIYHEDMNGANALHTVLRRYHMVVECAETLLKYDLFRNYQRNFRDSIRRVFGKMDCDYGEIADYLNHCESEILQMKEHYIDEYLSLYKFLYGNCFYTKDESMTHDYSLGLLRLIDEDTYPIYSDIIMDCVRTAGLVSHLIETEIYTVSCLGMSKVILNSDTIYHLCTFLSKPDLINLIRSFRDVYLNGNQCSDLPNFSASDLKEGTCSHHGSHSEVPLKKFKSKIEPVQSLDSSKLLRSVSIECITKKWPSNDLLNNSVNSIRSLQFQRKQHPYIA